MSNLLNAPYYTDKDLANEGFRHLGHNVRIARTCTIVGVENIIIGNNVRIDGYCTLAAAGKGNIELGSYIHIGGYCALLAAEGIVMEDMTTLSWGVKLFTRSDDFSGHCMTNPTIPEKYTCASKGKIMLKRHTVIGAGAIALPGTTAGEGTAVGALSMVAGDLAPWGIYAGVPAKRVNERSRDLLELEKAFLAETGFTSSSSARNER